MTVRIRVTRARGRADDSPVSRDGLPADKITTVRRAALGKCVGQASDEHVIRIGRAMLVFLGLAG